jgi:hypothetical protein
VRNRQNIPFKTRRSSTRFTPRTLVGNKGWITNHSKSVKSNRAINFSLSGKALNQISITLGIEFMSV